MKFVRLLVTVVVLVNLAACGSWNKKDETYGWSAQRIYGEAKESLDSGDYERAIKFYEILEAKFPFERFAQQAQLDMMYAYYKFEEPESAIATAERFIKLYPRHANLDYVYYLKGLVNFERDQGIISRYLPIDRSQRDQGAAVDSFRDFAELIKRYPESKYAQDTRERMVFLRNNLAEYELHVARYYMKRGAYVAAANRAKYVIESYQKTPAVPEALAIMAKAYKVLGLNDLSNSALRVLKLNYPNHQRIAEVESVTLQ